MNWKMELNLVSRKTKSTFRICIPLHRYIWFSPTDTNSHSWVALKHLSCACFLPVFSRFSWQNKRAPEYLLLNFSFSIPWPWIILYFVNWDWMSRTMIRLHRIPYQGSCLLIWNYTLCSIQRQIKNQKY